FCPPDYIHTYLKSELYHMKRNYGEFVCALRLMLDDLVNNKLVNNATGRQAYRVLYLSYAEAAADIFLRKSVGGEYLALPIVLIGKLNRAITRTTRAYERVTLRGHADSVVVAELVHKGLTVDQIVQFLIDRTVLFYYNLGSTVYCELKNQWERVRSADSPVNMAFAKFGTPCIRKRDS
ncbi:hypothetical protein CSKR_106293, partial [Clonorchis sinensis]